MFFSPFEQFDILSLINFFAFLKSDYSNLESLYSDSPLFFWIMSYFGTLNFWVKQNLVLYSVVSIVFVIISVQLFVWLFTFATRVNLSLVFSISGLRYVVISIRNSLRQIAEAQLSIAFQEYFLIFLLVYIYVFCCNVLGLIPYTFTWTSHFTTTLMLSGIYFFGNVFLAIYLKGYKGLGIFLPSEGILFVVKMLLAVIEIVSFIARVFSLSIRLCANMMAGHTLLKFIVGFCWASFMDKSLVMFFVPLVILVCVYILEIVVAMLQSFVFGVLGIIYINDSISEGH